MLSLWRAPKVFGFLNLGARIACYGRRKADGLGSGTRNQIDNCSKTIIEIRHYCVIERPQKFHSALISFALFLLIFPALSVNAATTRDFPIPKDIVTDYTGTLSEDQLTEIRSALENTNRANGLQGNIIINSNTGEWYLDEYVKDYGDYLQAKGRLESTGWLLYLSLGDRKFGFAVQADAAKSLSSARIRDLSFMLSEYLAKDDIAGGIIAVTNSIGELSSPKTAVEKKKMEPDLLIFAGILVITAVLMYRLRKYRKEPVQAKGRSV